jgi:sulfur carrier protein ThiS adenylyltransferase
MSEIIADLNSQVRVRTIKQQLTGDQLRLECMLADVVLDCSDNMPTRQAVNRACVEHHTPLISASAIGWNGQLVVFDSEDTSPCYHCLFPFDEFEHVGSCSDLGVLGPVPHMLGSYQALQAIKLLTGNLAVDDMNALRLFAGLVGGWQSLTINKDPDCPVCSDKQQVSNAVL